MPVGNDTVKHNLMQVRCLQLEHLIDTRTTDLIRRAPDLLGRPIIATKRRANQILAVSVKQVQGGLVSTRRDLNELGEAIADLRHGQRAQEGKVQEGVDGRVVGAQPVLVPSVVDTDFDGHGGVDEPDDGGRDTDEVGAAAVGGTSEA